MRNFTLLTVALLLAATTSFAQTGRKIRHALNRDNVRQLTELPARHARAERARSLENRQAAQPKAPRRIGEEYGIVEQPEGKLYANLVANFEGLAYSWLSGFYSTTTDVGAITVVEGTDGNLYIQNLVPALYDDVYYWIKAEHVSGDNYVIHKQPAGFYEYWEEVDYVTLLALNAEGTSYEEAANTDIKVTWKDGVLATTAELATGEMAFGVVYQDYNDDDELEWYWDGSVYWNLSTSVQTDTYSEPSSAATVQEMILKYKQVNESYATPVSVAFDGNDVYFRLYESVPGWIKGSLSGNKITIKGGQYMGVDSDYGNHAYMHVSEAEIVWNEDEEDPDNSYWGYEFKSILDEDVLDYDATAKTISGKNVITIDGAKDDIYYADLYDQPYLYVFQEVPACPADPDITYFYNYDEEYGYGLVDFGITTLDINGDYITPEKLSYTVYFDDEAFEFDPEEYMSLDEAITEIPYTFDDSYDITTYGSDKEISFYFSVAKNVGIQTIYRGGGEVHKSNIVFYDINENSFSVVDVEDPIRTGALSPVSTQRVASESYHDLTGRTVNASARGLIIKTVTFADGTRKSYKLVRR